MRMGVQLPEVERLVRWPEYAAMARAAEDAGFASIWVGDHVLSRGDGRPERGPWDAWTLLAALAATTRVRLGPLVACTAFAPPGLLARKAAAVHEVSGGRLVLGLGAGWNEAEFAAFGLPFDRRASRFEEAFDVVRRLLAGERVSYTSDFGSADDAVVLPLPDKPVPLMVGSIGERVLRATLPYVDGWNAWFDWFDNTPEGYAARNDRVTTICRDVGRDPAEVERSAEVFVALDDAGSDRPHAHVEPVRGTTAEMAVRLAEFADAGVEEAILVVSPITERSIRQLGDLVAAARPLK
jgi:alkanesulfonate monooxygenase SsuD/methylene tetrahydromethanopterin reductase-like flavin-dependent oxidoreductase (luciferase family)